MSISVNFEPTPNPNSMKFLVSQTLCDEAISFNDPVEAERSPLAAKIFGFPWASGVYLGCDFITITKQDWVDWDILQEPLAQIIKEHVENSQPILLKKAEEQNEANADDSEVVKQIKHILNTEIRPFVAMDGGDIVFHKYENNILQLILQGACSGCPSSTATLKNGVEARLKEVIPELKEVVQVF